MNLKKVLKEAMPSVKFDDPGGEVTIPGIGRMDYKQLKTNLERKLEDLLRRAKTEQFHTIGKEQLEVVNLFWLAAREYKDSLI